MQPGDLKKAGLSTTLPRLKILQYLESAKQRHLSAEEIYRGLGAAGEEIGLATVYRVLHQFETAGLVRRLNLDHQRAVYELDSGRHHDHMLCTRCGQIVEFEDAVIESQQHAIAARNGWALNDHALVLYGLCPACRGA